MPELHILATAEDVAQSAVPLSRMGDLARRCPPPAEAQGRFSIGLSGVSTPKSAAGGYRVLASNPYRASIDWRSWHMFWGDERCVPIDGPDSNFGMVKTRLRRIPASQVHRMRGEVPPAESALEYEAQLRSHFQMPAPSFDLVLLGLGDDGHAAATYQPEITAVTRGGLRKERLDGITI